MTRKKKKRKKEKFPSYLILRAKREVLDSFGPVAVIPGRNKEDGESLTKLERVFI